MHKDELVQAGTFDSASDLPIISLKFIRSHPTFVDVLNTRPIPPWISRPKERQQLTGQSSRIHSL